MSDWCIIDVFDDNVSQSSNVILTWVTIANNVRVHKYFFSWWMQELLWMILEIRRSFFRRCRSTLIAKIVNIRPPQLISPKEKKTWIKLSAMDNVAFYEQSWRWWNRMFFCMKLDFSTFFTDFCGRRFRCTIVSISKQKHCNVFGSSFREIWFSDWVHFFLNQYERILLALFCGISAKITIFR